MSRSLRWNVEIDLAVEGLKVDIQYLKAISTITTAKSSICLGSSFHTIEDHNKAGGAADFTFDGRDDATSHTNGTQWKPIRKN